MISPSECNPGETLPEGIWIEFHDMPRFNRIILIWTDKRVLYGPVAFKNRDEAQHLFRQYVGKPTHFLTIPQAPLKP